MVHKICPLRMLDIEENADALKLKGRFLLYTHKYEDIEFGLIRLPRRCFSNMQTLHYHCCSPKVALCRTKSRDLLSINKEFKEPSRNSFNSRSAFCWWRAAITFKVLSIYQINYICRPEHYSCTVEAAISTGGSQDRYGLRYFVKIICFAWRKTWRSVTQLRNKGSEYTHFCMLICKLSGIGVCLTANSLPLIENTPL